MKVLMLGGTRFVGWHLAEAAVARGHEVTLFHRGQSRSTGPAGTQSVLGDRSTPTTPLPEGEWDLCIDVCGYLPADVERSATELADRVGRYAFVSTVSVYGDRTRFGLTEDDAVAPCPEALLDERLDKHTYGPFKGRCEAHVQETFGHRATIVRPGLITGPLDTTERFGWWVRRLRRGGDVLAPGPQSAGVQWIDARDLAEFTLDLAEKEIGGVYNAVGPERSTGLSDFLEGMNAALGSPADLHWVDSGFLLDRGVTPWEELPLWIPEDGERGLMTVDGARSRGLGLKLRPLAETLRDFAAWMPQTMGADGAKCLSPEREASLLAHWGSLREEARRPALAAGHEI